MNIFYIHDNPVIAAQAMTDKHVVKMILESAQLLSTAHRALDGQEFIQLSKSGARLRKWNHPDAHMDITLYKSTHLNHPSGIWVRQSSENYMWLYKHFIALSEEYYQRYGKRHASELLLSGLLSKAPNKIPHIRRTPMLVAITDTQWHVPNNPLQSYRNYYVGEKLKTPKDTDRYYKVLGLKEAKDESKVSNIPQVRELLEQLY
jgi:hypothetical protein